MKELYSALSKVQSQLSVAKKDSTNPHFKSKYADLESCWDACREPLTKNGFSIVQRLYTSLEGKPGLITELCHESGQMISSEVLLPISKPGSQEMGSCIKYMRRYSLAALVGITDGEDDDAERAEGRWQKNNSNPSPTIQKQNNTPLNQSSMQSATGYAPDPHPMPPSNYTPSKYPLTQPQLNRMSAIARKSNWSQKFVDLYVKTNYKKNNADLSKVEYEKVCQYFSDTPFTDEIEWKLEPVKKTDETIMQKFEKAKKGYVDQTQGGVDESESLPF